VQALANEIRQRYMPCGSWGELSVTVTDDRGITEMNRRHLGRDGPTDVIAFGYLPIPGESAAIDGDIIVNLERAWQEAARRKCSPERELATYITHGLLHLTGEDDATPAQRRRMRRLEQTVISRVLKEKDRATSTFAIFRQGARRAGGG